MAKKKPKTYSLKEIGDVKMDLKDVKMGTNWENAPGFDSTYYVPKDKLIKPCSYCGKESEVCVIEGVQLLGGGDDRTKKKIYHQTLHLLCESCATARQV
jgi:hypothetical protein